MSNQRPSSFNTNQNASEAVASQNLERVLSALTHDLRAPVRHIHGFIGLLEDHLGSALDEEGSDYLQFIVQASTTIQSQMTALDRLSNSIGREYIVEERNGNELLNAALDRLRADLEDRVQEIDASTLPLVTGDREALILVFQELIANWLRFCPPGTRLTITAQQDATSHALIFKDNGPGFNTDDPACAFTIFKRFHDSEISGSGVGLTIVEQVVHRHGGTVSLATAPGEGVEVRVVFPALPEQPGDAA